MRRFVMHDLQPKVALGSDVVFVIGNAYHVHQAAGCSVLHAASGDELQVTPRALRMYFEALIDMYWSVTFGAQCKHFAVLQLILPIDPEEEQSDVYRCSFQWISTIRQSPEWCVVLYWIHYMHCCSWNHF